MSETILEGGDVNLVVRIGDTVRRPTGPWSPAVHALLQHFEAVGFDGAPHFLGIDEQGREVLSYVEGDAAVAPAPGDDVVVEQLGRLIRRMHDAQDGFADPGGWVEPTSGAMICFHDYFPPNVIFRGGCPVALIDWDLALPGDRADDVAMAAAWWVPLRPDAEAERWGFPLERRGQRLRLLCDGYGLRERGDVVRRYVERRRANVEEFQRRGDAVRLARSREGVRWLEEHQQELEAWL